MRKKVIVVFSVLIIAALFFGIGARNFLKTHMKTEDYIEAHSLTIESENGSEVKSFSDIGVNILDNKKYITVNNPEISLDENKLKIFIENLDGKQTEAIYPEIIKENNEYIVTSYDNGTKLDNEKLFQTIKQNYKNLEVKINLSDFYKTYEPGKSPEELYEDLTQKLSSIKSFSIEYDNNKSLSYDDIKDFICLEDDTFKVDESEELKKLVKDFVNENASLYETYKNEWDFVTTDGQNIKIKTDSSVTGQGVYGNKVNYTKEYEEVLNLVLSLTKNENRVPVFERDGQSEIPNTYVEVSKEKQHVWFYKDGVLVMESGCVTGRKNSMDTPCGVFYVFEKAHNVNFPTGGSSVNWMKFTSRGHGLHDARWRNASQFNNPSTYLSNGSHGCVNLPKEFSDKLYEVVDIGTVVIIY